MPKTNLSDEGFAAAWKKAGSAPTATAKALGMSKNSVLARRDRMAKRGYILQTVDPQGRETAHSPRVKFERRRDFTIKDGIVVLFSDPHFYPDHKPVAMDALVAVVKELKPHAVLCGGDVLDGTQIGRHDPTRGWHTPPSVREQIDCVVENMDRVKAAAGKKAITAMTLGNHDCRLSRYLAVNAPHMEDMPGTRLEDFIPAWPLSWTIRINDDTVLRHRNMAGMLHLQGVKAGCHYIHGHLHKLNVHAQAVYNRWVYSVDLGSLADPDTDAFDYAEDSPGHAQGFAVLTYKNGELLWPELCYVLNGQAWFRGQKV